MVYAIPIKSSMILSSIGDGTISSKLAVPNKFFPELKYKACIWHRNKGTFQKFYTKIHYFYLLFKFGVISSSASIFGDSSSSSVCEVSSAPILFVVKVFVPAI